MKFLAFWLGVVCWSWQASAQDLTDPAAILRKSREAYETCATCLVDGQRRSETSTAPSPPEIKEMHLAFSRKDDLFRLDWSEMNPVTGGHKTNSVFTREGKTYFYWGSLGRFELPKDRRMALAAATGISSGLAYFLPSLLLHESNPLAVKDPALRPGVILDGQPCYVVTGTVRQGSSPFEVAIDEKTFAVVQIKETDHITNQDHQETIARLKKSNPALAERLAATPPIPDFDVESVTVYHTQFGAPVTKEDCDYPVPAGMQPTESR